MAGHALGSPFPFLLCVLLLMPGTAALGPTCVSSACAATSSSQSGTGDCAGPSPASRQQGAHVAFSGGWLDMSTSCTSKTQGGTNIVSFDSAVGTSRFQLLWSGSSATNCRSYHYVVAGGNTLRDGDLGCPLGAPPAVPTVLP